MRQRRNFSAEFKAKVVLEIISGTKSAAEICREHNLKPDLLSHWKNQFLANASKVFENGKEADPQQVRMEELEKLAGKQSLEIEILHLPWRAVPGKKGVDDLAPDPQTKLELSRKMAEQYSKTAVCQALNVKRSSLYYQSCRGETPALKSAIQDVCACFPCYGYRRVTAELHRRHWLVNRKRVARLMADMGLQAKKVVRKRRTTDSVHPFPRYPNLVQGRVVQHPDEVWVADITYVRLKHGFVYLAVLMDVCTRAIRGWHLGRTLEQALTLEALLKAFATQHCPQIHHSDQGVQYAATEYTDLLQAQGVRISMAEVGEPTQNGYAERLMRTIKEEEVDLSDYEDYHHAYQQIGQFLDDVYMRKRVHASLNYLTPTEFEALWH